MREPVPRPNEGVPVTPAPPSNMAPQRRAQTASASEDQPQAVLSTGPEQVRGEYRRHQPVAAKSMRLPGSSPSRRLSEPLECLRPFKARLRRASRVYRHSSGPQRSQ